MAGISVIAFFTFIGGLILCGAVGAFASGRNRSGIAWFFIAFFVTPIIAFIVVAILPKDTDEKEEAAKREVYRMKSDAFINKYIVDEDNHSRNSHLKSIYNDLSSSNKVDIKVIEGALSIM